MTDKRAIGKRFHGSGAVAPRSTRARARWIVVAVLVTLVGWVTFTFAQDENSGSVEPGPATGATESLETFVPTEEVGVDQAVAFPVDI